MCNKKIKIIIITLIILLIFTLFISFIYIFFIKVEQQFSGDDIFPTRAIEIDDLFAVYHIKLPKTRYEKFKIYQAKEEYIYGRQFEKDVHAYEHTITYKIKSRNDNAMFIFEDRETKTRYTGYFYAITDYQKTSENEKLILNRIFNTIYNIYSEKDIKKTIGKNSKIYDKNQISIIYNIVKTMELSSQYDLDSIKNKDKYYKITIKTKNNYNILFNFYYEDKIIQHNGCYFDFNSDEDFMALLSLFS
ncbi:MAG: hypothetical protein ACYCWE_18060 [Eubacteriales bacterium]